MKNVFILILSFVLSSFAFAETKKLFYIVEKGDTFGSIILSLGHLKLWSGSAYVNKFKNKVSPKEVSQVNPGDKIRFSETEIIFRKNIEVEGDQIFIKKKIKKIAQWEEQRKLEEAVKPTKAPEVVIVEKEDSTVVYENKNWTMDLYPGFGGFLAQDGEQDRSTQTKTQTGLQPMLQLKGIYSHSSVGSIAFDVLAKKIINSKFSFPVNTDFRLQYIPKWIDLGNVNLAVSYSRLRHSYVGKPLDEEIEYELQASFLGVGLVWPRESWWYEIYLEKAVNGKTESDEQDIALHEGWRIDSELIYPVSKKLRIIPGINYYTTKNSSQNYQMSVFELRSTLVWELNL